MNRTIEARYTIAALTGEKNIDGLTLYEARAAIIAAAQRGVVNDATHIRRSDRCVGFWSEWHGQVRAMFGAHDDERELLTAWA